MVIHLFLRLKPSIYWCNSTYLQSLFAFFELMVKTSDKFTYTITFILIFYKNNINKFVDSAQDHILRYILSIFMQNNEI